jgi:uncharacterized membrane-anchored protein YjiN (DUF445 family)
MSIKSTVQQFTGNFKAIQSVIPHLNKIVKSKSEDEIFEALIDDTRFDAFMDEVYNRLPAHVKLQIKKEQLIPIISSTKAGLLKKKKFKKKILEHEAKLAKRKELAE